MDDTKNKALDPRKLEELYRAFENADYILSKRYRYQLGDYPVCEPTEELKKIEFGDNFQIFRISKLVYDQNENTLDKLTTAYQTLASYPDAGIIMLLISDGNYIEVYGGTACRNTDDAGKCHIRRRAEQWSTLHSALEANFPGGEFADAYAAETDRGKKINFNRAELVERVFPRHGIVTAVTGVAALRGDKNGKNENFVQGLEKLIDAMRGKAFSALFLADCMETAKIESICANYEDIYSQLSPFLQSQQTVGRSDGISDTESLISGVTDTTNESLSTSESRGTTTGRFQSNSIGGSVSTTVGTPIGTPVSVSATVSANYNHTQGTSEGTSDTRGTSRSTGSSKSLSSQNSVAKALSTTTNDGIQITYQNRAVKTLMERIDEQIKRLRSCEDYGVYDFGAYFVANETPISKTAASIYCALMRGENSSVEASAISTWSKENSDLAAEYLKRMYHPQIAIPDYTRPIQTEIDGPEYEIQTVTPTTLISGKELAIQMCLPKKSVNGLAVLDCAEFGREVLTFSGAQAERVKLGNITHMRKTSDTPVNVERKNLTAHTFITGSTGAGKSNTIYMMLDRLCLSGGGETHFLVVEPAKGEYRAVFGGYPNVSVYGTNPQKAVLLQMNPFSFPDDIHVLEHIDRLVEIFNACWPMYAAMPAVLKEAIEESYVSCGWSLTRSACVQKRFPTFASVLEKLPEILIRSSYSADTKGDYTGALVTRIKSLTNGINSLIFCSEDEISNERLFDENVIVDLSRVGSVETKSLLMGILVMKLQEYRMCQGGENAALKHVTVLEEAHNLLRRTSSEQSQDSSNLQGKSVEMLANAIAEMRTYGEGFIIADQAPGLLDMAVIRNTNTKIIMRLPDEQDRQLVGRAAGLNDEQIVELAKLDTGVAAVYQNNWLEPVLCQIDEFKDKRPYRYEEEKTQLISPEKTKFLRCLMDGVSDDEELSAEEIEKIKRWIDCVDAGIAAKHVLWGTLEKSPFVTEQERHHAIYCLLKGKHLIEQGEKKADIQAAQQLINAQIAERLQVDLQLAEELRKMIYLYAVERVREDADRVEHLRRYGGIQ